MINDRDILLRKTAAVIFFCFLRRKASYEVNFEKYVMRFWTNADRHLWKRRAFPGEKYENRRI